MNDKEIVQIKIPHNNNRSKNICDIFKFICIFYLCLYSDTFDLIGKCVLQIAEYGFHWVLNDLGKRLNISLGDIRMFDTIRNVLPMSRQRQRQRQSRRQNGKVSITFIPLNANSIFGYTHNCPNK